MLGGISTLTSDEKPAEKPQPAPTADEPPRHNYMADIIERHEAISYRAKKTK